MKYFFDFEFLEDGRTIEPISMGVVSLDGRQLYLEFDFDEARARAHPWLSEHVLPQLFWPPEKRVVRAEACEQILDFIPVEDPLLKQRPELWAYYASYDWIAMCQLFGTMLDLPEHFPMFCLDLQQWWYQLGRPKQVKPPDPKGEHNALQDALWNRDLHDALAAYSAKKG